MRLFSEDKRVFEGRKLHAEPSYDYLDRSARAEARAIREVYEDWCRRYPDKDKPDLLGRFTSPIDAQHVSAAYELYLFELFSRLGYEVTVHPETSSDKASRPDFLLTSGEGEHIYVEAVQSIEISDEERAAQARLNVVFDTISRLEVTGWLLGVDAATYPGSPPSGKRLRAALKSWLEELDPDEVAQQIENNGHDAFPSFEWQEGDWRIRFTAFPRSPEKRDNPVESVLGVYLSEVRYLNTWERIRDTLESKGLKYGELDAPLIVAVNASVFHLDDIDIMQALFGQQQFIIDPDNPQAELPMRHAPNGFWHGPNGPRHRHVCGVIIGFDIQPWTVAIRPITLFHNPWTPARASGPISRLPQKIPNKGKMEAVTGENLSALLALPASYPGMAETA